MKTGGAVALLRSFAFLAIQLMIISLLSTLILALVFALNADERWSPLSLRIEMMLEPQHDAIPAALLLEQIRRQLSPLPVALLEENPLRFEIAVGSARPEIAVREELRPILDAAKWDSRFVGKSYMPLVFEDLRSEPISLFVWAVLIQAGLLGLVGLGMWYDRPPFPILFASPSRRSLVAGSAIVAGLLLSAWAYASMLPAVIGDAAFAWPLGNDRLGMLGNAVPAILAAAADEIFFRGYALAFLTKRIGTRAAVVITSLLFALERFDPTFFLFFFGFSIVLALVALRTKSLTLPIFIHGGFSAILILSML